MTTSPYRKPPHSADVILSLSKHNKHVILKWLVTNMLDDCTLTPSNLSAVDSDGYWRWRMALNSKDNRVLFERQEDVQLFLLAWGNGD